MSEDYKVHASHCCKWHGCKYGPRDKCPVVKGEVEQLYLCEDCEDELTDAEYHTQVVSRLPEMYELKIKSLKRTFKEAFDHAQKQNGEHNNEQF